MQYMTTSYSIAKLRKATSALKNEKYAYNVPERAGAVTPLGLARIADVVRRLDVLRST